MRSHKYLFQFKNFSLRHDSSTMKVGTDGVMLGAWAAKSDIPTQILDVGTGCGIIAMMMAQRFQDSNILGIDIHLDSVLEAQENVKNFELPYTSLEMQSIDYLDFITDSNFDLIISNPPYFSDALLSDVMDKNRVRHQQNLTMDKFLSKSHALLNRDGKIALILPIKEMNETISVAQSMHLYPLRICYVSSFEEQSPIRAMAEFVQNTIDTPTTETLYIYEKDKTYSEVYRNLTRDFYLKF